MFYLISAGLKFFLSKKEEKWKGHTDSDAKSAYNIKPDIFHGQFLAFDHHPDSTYDKENNNIQSNRGCCLIHECVLYKLEEATCRRVEIVDIIRPSDDQSDHGQQEIEVLKF